MSRPFVHLHCHTHYSLLDGATRIPDLVAKCKASGMNAVAITDHGNLYGALEFYQACKAGDVKPIVGLEAYVARGASRFDRSAKSTGASNHHLTLLAKDATGFRNLVKLSSAGYLEGFHYKPRIDKELLAAHSEGLICLSGCASSELSHLQLSDRLDAARELVEWYVRVFGDRFYLEIQNCGVEIQKLCMDATVDMARAMGLPLVATSDAHYLEREDAGAHDVLLCVSTRAQRSDEKRMRFDNDQFHVRTPEEMYAAFPGHEEAVARSQAIADRVDIDLDLTKRYYPVFVPPDEKTDTEYLRELCEQGLVWRYGEEGITAEHRRRLDDELGVIERMGYASYFLIVWDFVRFATSEDIPCQARGSACGALVAFVLGLSNVCPLKYDLLFERFLDPNRTEPPDIDIDFCRDGRQKVIDYTKARYGEANVAQIGTFGTLKAKAAIRDVGRALGIDLGVVNEVCKNVPETLGIKLKDALAESAELKEMYDRRPDIKEMFDIALRLENLARSASTHAAGVVVADEPLDTYVPLQKISGKEDVLTQWDGPTVEQAGLLKMDFLGLRNLTILHEAVANVKRHAGVDLDPLELPLDDEATFALLQRGETKGIFQLESGGMRDLLTKMRPDKFEDIIATSALYRPGPLEGGMVMQYVDVKNGRRLPEKVHPLVDEVLEETYGVMVYQEQVMRILNRVGGIELSSAYRCIKAISKKKLKTIAEFRDQYVAGARERGLDEKLAVDLFEMIEKFAGYGFNKSHSTAYAAVAYQTAYLKAHYPKEFMAALLSCGMESSDRIAEHVDDARRMGIAILPPDVNKGGVEFGVVGDAISFGLGAIKGVGETALEAIVAEREANGRYTDVFDLCERVDPAHLNRATLEVLIKAGALDSLGPNREQHMLVVERALQSAAALHRDRARGQRNLFGGDDDAAGGGEVERVLPQADDWPHRQKLAVEKEVLGFYLTSHPIAEMADKLEAFASHTTDELADLEDGEDVIVAGMVSATKKATTKKPSRNGHTRYLNFDLEDPRGVVRCIMWPEEYARYGEKVREGSVFFVKGKVDKRGREPNVVVNQFFTPDEAERAFVRRVALKFLRGLHSETDVTAARDVLVRFPGRTDVMLVVESRDDDPPHRSRRYVMALDGVRVDLSGELPVELRRILGEGNVKLFGPKRRKSPGANGNGGGNGNGHG